MLNDGLDTYSFCRRIKIFVPSRTERESSILDMKGKTVWGKRQSARVWVGGHVWTIGLYGIYQFLARTSDARTTVSRLIFGIEVCVLLLLLLLMMMMVMLMHMRLMASVSVFHFWGLGCRLLLFFCLFICLPLSLNLSGTSFFYIFAYVLCVGPMAAGQLGTADDFDRPYGIRRRWRPGSTLSAPATHTERHGRREWTDGSLALWSVLLNLMGRSGGRCDGIKSIPMRIKWTEAPPSVGLGRFFFFSWRQWRWRPHIQNGSNVRSSHHLLFRTIIHTTKSFRWLSHLDRYLAWLCVCVCVCSAEKKQYIEFNRGASITNRRVAWHKVANRRRPY